MKKILLSTALFGAIALMSPSIANAADQSFDQWLNGAKAEARSNGISEDIIRRAFTGVTPVPRIIELDRKQPEGTMTFAKYRKRIINDARVAQGQRLLKKHSAELAKASAKYGVPPQYIVALWGIETSYGNNTGGFSVVQALSTLAHDGRRSAFFRKELMNALKILNEGHISPESMKGSWAGAMGQNQFMPSSFHAYAVDGNGDGKRDIWTSLPDVFASTANYLSTSGWREDERWGRAVKAPANIPDRYRGLDYKASLATWKSLGVTLPGGGALPQADGIQASLVQPDGKAGPAYLAYKNYRVIMRWNKSTYFATSVGLLADAIARGK